MRKIEWLAVTATTKVDKAAEKEANIIYWISNKRSLSLDLYIM